MRSTLSRPLSVLAVDDETQMQRLLTLALETEGYRVTTAGTGGEALAIAARHRHDLFLIELGLPDMSGTIVLKRLREWTQAPAIIISVVDAEEDKIEALDSGADDFVTKPFSTGELLARMRAALRRANKTPADEPVFRSGNLEVDLAARKVCSKGQPVKLTATEYDLLRLFVQHAGKVLTHRQILREIWGSAHENNTQYLRVYMGRLRQKLEAEPDDQPVLLTEPGVGYRLVEEKLKA
jgi:two-component system KDP operon response regulator KdpE